MRRGPLFVTQAGLLSGRCFGGVSTTLPPAVGFGLLGWSVAGVISMFSIVQFSCLFEPHAIGAIFATVLFLWGLGV